MNQYQPAAPAEDTDLSRRGFLRTGLLGATILGTASIGASLSGCTTAPVALREVNGKIATYRFLNEDDQVLLTALAPAILAGALPEDRVGRDTAVATIVLAVDEAIYRFGPANQAEFRKLFDLLNFAPTRALLAGVWSSWDGATPSQAEAFLQRWRHSGIGLFNSAYGALIKVTNVASYGSSGNWTGSHYPGPPAYALAALPQFQSSSNAGLSPGSTR